MQEFSSGTHAGLWLMCPSPQLPGATWDSADWQSFLWWRLGVFQDLPPKCAACGNSQDRLGDHALCCTSSGLYGRHNHVRDTLAAALCSMGFPCRTEVRLPGTELIPADIFIPVLAEDSPTAVDISVVHPLPVRCSSWASRPTTPRSVPSLGWVDRGNLSASSGVFQGLGNLTSWSNRR